MTTLKNLTAAAFLLFGLNSAWAADSTYAFECYGTAAAAAKAIDALNFPGLDQATVSIGAEVQKEKKARIDVSFGSSANRQYTIRLRKNRSAKLVGDQVTTEPGCYIESVN